MNFLNTCIDAYFCHTYTPFTFDWYGELHKGLDKHYDELVKNRGNILGDNKGYPIQWTEVLGDIFHPLNLTYMEYILKNNKL